VRFRVCCSKGTYIRTLAEDIGEALGCGAHLTQLRREKTGGFDVGEALTLEAIGAVAMPERFHFLRPIDALVADYPRIELDAAMTTRLRLGQRLPWNVAGVSQPGHYRTYSDNGEFIGLVHAIDGGLRPERLVAQASPGD
jgi:tRNA pseudouridine55 synthase